MRIRRRAGSKVISPVSARYGAATDFAAAARTLDRMGLAGMDAAQITRTFDSGFA